MKMALEEFSVPTLGTMEHQLEKFFKEVLGMKNFHLPTFDYAPLSLNQNALMYVHWDFTEQMIIEAYRKKWDFECYGFKHSITELVTKSLEEPRSEKAPGYYFTFHLGLIPDEDSLGKWTFKSLLESGLIQTLNLKEYLLASRFMKFTYGEFMDSSGTRTITSSRWSKDHCLHAHCERDSTVASRMWIRKEHVSLSGHESSGPRSIVLSDTFE